MNVEGTTLQERAVAWVVLEASAPPTTREVATTQVPYVEEDGTVRLVRLGFGAASATLVGLVDREVVEVAGVAPSGAYTWKITDEAVSVVEGWVPEIEGLIAQVA